MYNEINRIHEQAVNDMKLLVIGDSLITGYGVPSDKSWLSLVQNESDEMIISKGVDGNTSSDILMRFVEDVVCSAPDIAFIMAGTNDALNGRTANYIFNNVLEMIKLCIENGIPPIVMLQPVINIEMAGRIHGDGLMNYEKAANTIKRYRRLIEDYCTDEHIDTIDFNKAFNELDVELQPDKYYIDGIHLTEFAHQKVAEKFIYKFNYILVQKEHKDFIVNYDTVPTE